jgi:arabinan endo-1,5-alpha-L-arabinosidase
MTTSTSFVLASVLLMISLPNQVADRDQHSMRKGDDPSYAVGSDDSAFPFDGFVPENAVDVHDPAIIDFDGHYICFSTSGNGFGVVRTSDDLIHWKVHGPIIRQTPDWLRQAIPQHRSIWAPEARRFGKVGLRLYYCASQAFGHNTSWIGLAQCDHFDPARPAEGWHDLGPIIDSKEGRDNFNAIDPSTLLDPTGRLWMYFGSYWSGLYVVELDPDTGMLKQPSNPDKTLIACNTEDRGNGLEAPNGIYKDGYYYLFVSYGLAAQGVRSTYHIVAGRSKNPQGPFMNAAGIDMVQGGHEDILNASAPMFGPGGQTVVQDTKGTWLMALHYYDGRVNWHGHVWGKPTLQVRQLLWAKDGWPLPGLPVTPKTNELLRKKEDNVVGTWLHQVDFGAIQRVEIKSAGICVLNSEIKGTWTKDGDTLEFKWPGDEPGTQWVDSLILGYGDQYYVGRNQGRLVIRGFRINAK